MSKVNFFVFQIFLFSSVVHAGGTLVRSGSVSAFSRTVTAFAKTASGSGTFLSPVIKQAIDSLADLGSNAVPWLGSSALIFKLRQVFQQDLQKADEIETEANRREKLGDEVLHREKSWDERWDEKNRRIKELKEKILDNRNKFRVNKDEPSEEDMKEELHELLTKPLKTDLVDDDEVTVLLASETKPGIIEQPVVGSFAMPRGWTAPVGEVPPEFRCPITTEIMEDPVTAADGFSYERSAIEQWINQHRNSGNVNSPMTGAPLANLNLVPNITLRNMMRDSKINRRTTTEPGSPDQPAFICTPATAGVKPHGILEARDVPRCEWKPGRADTLASLEEVVAMSTRVSEEGWRLPSIWELSILSQQPNLRDDLKTGIVWSTTQFDRSSALCINFADRSLCLNGPNEPQAIHRVRSLAPALPPPAPTAGQVPGERVVRTATARTVNPPGVGSTQDVGELEWELGRKNSQPMTLQQIKAYAASRAAEGWRLPTVWELYALYQQKSVLGDDLDAYTFWSGTAVGPTHWRLDFRRDFLDHFGDGTGFACRVRLVRSVGGRTPPPSCASRKSA